MKNKPEETPKIAVKFANMVFALVILFSILLTVYAIYKIYNTPESVSLVFYIICIISGCVFVALFSYGLKRLSNNLKVNLSILFFTIGITIYGFEAYLELRYDGRTKMEVLDDLRDTGVEAIPNMFPSSFVKSNGLTSKKGRIYPLGTISNSITILSNEGGYYPIIEVDEYGFNNPKGLYVESKVDIVLTGDSFTEGYSVHSNKNISGVLRQFDLNVINFGKSGNGPLVEFATLKEYAEPLKPKIVLWLYFMNDLDDLSMEMQSSLLKKYLNEDDYSQNLISRQEEIDDVLINYLYSLFQSSPTLAKIFSYYDQSKPKSERIIESGKLSNNPVIRIAKLYNLRQKINLVPIFVPTYPTLPKTPEVFYHIFRDILQKSKQMVLGWEGKMYFVYLPAFERYSIGNEGPNRNFVMQTAAELEIPIIDIHKEVFDSHPDPLSLFPFRRYGHYNAEGYRLVAEAIKKRLEEDGYFTIKSKK